MNNLVISNIVDMEERTLIIERIDNLKDELLTLNIKQQAFVEAICSLRTRVDKIDRRKREIHNEVKKLKVIVGQWGASQKVEDLKNSL